MRLLTVLFTVALLGAFPTAAKAELVTWYFLGRIDDAYGPIDGSVRKGFTRFCGEFTFETEMGPDFVAPGGALMEYYQHIANGATWTVSMGNYTYTEREMYRLQTFESIVNDDWRFVTDNYVQSSGVLTDGTSEWTGFSFGLNFLYGDGTTFNDLGPPLPTEPFSVTDFGYAFFYLHGHDFAFGGGIDVLSDRPIAPEPTTAVLLTCGLGAMTLVARRRWRAHAATLLLCGLLISCSSSGPPRYADIEDARHVYNARAPMSATNAATAAAAAFAPERPAAAPTLSVRGYVMRPYSGGCKVSVSETESTRLYRVDVEMPGEHAPTFVQALNSWDPVEFTWGDLKTDLFVRSVQGGVESVWVILEGRRER